MPASGEAPGLVCNNPVLHPVFPDDGRYCQCCLECVMLPGILSLHFLFFQMA